MQNMDNWSSVLTSALKALSMRNTYSRGVRHCLYAMMSDIKSEGVKITSRIIPKRQKRATRQAQMYTGVSA